MAGGGGTISFMLEAGGSEDDLSADTGIGENLQQNGMVHPAIDERHFVHARLDGGDRALHFRDHALVDDTGLFESLHLINLQVGDEGGWILGIAQEPWHVAHENQPFGLERYGGLGRGNVGVAIVDFSTRSQRGGTDYRGDAPPDALAQRLGVDCRHFAHEPAVEAFAGRALEEQLAALENFRAGEAARPAAERVESLDNLRVDFARQDLFDHVHRRLVGQAQALDKAGLQPGGIHRAGDRLAAAVDDHRVDANGFQENDVARDAIANLRVGRVHETAAVFHHERLTAESLDVRQGFQQRRGFGDEVLHRVV